MSLEGQLRVKGNGGKQGDYDNRPGKELCNGLCHLHHICCLSLPHLVLTPSLSPNPHTGGKILLNGARLVLKRGRRYGLCGANGVGKSTLMKAIAANKVDGFPPPDKLRTVYVEHDIQATLEELTVGLNLALVFCQDFERLFSFCIYPATEELIAPMPLLFPIRWWTSSCVTPRCKIWRARPWSRPWAR